ncbi:Exoskeleton protein RP43, partial [Lamellibrachia satsuma]
SDSTITKAGFRIQYSVVSCKRLKVLTASKGYFGTLGSGYGNYETCSWKIQALPHRRIVLEFISFSLEPHSSCRYDSVKVYNGGSDKAPSLGTFCGFSKPATVYSTSSTVFVTFTSDGSKTYSGFRIKYWTYGAREPKAKDGLEEVEEGETREEREEMEVGEGGRESE